MTVEDVHALPPGHRLNHYRIESVIGRGGFGITYHANDTVLQKAVAIKEYLPVEFAVRASGASVQPRSRRAEPDFRWGLERFLDEARTLARFRHPNLVPVLVFFEANGTAYMVMEFERGRSLSEILAQPEQRRRLASTLPGLLEGVLSALREVHAAGFLHRDIKPANIILRYDGTPVLVDFGSARHAMGARSRTLTSIVTPRYAPIEQYSLDSRQGPWSDLYGLAAVLHHVLVGEAPPEAVNRIRDDPYRPLAGRADLANLPHRLLQAVDCALAVHAEQRPQSVAAFQALAGGSVLPVAEAPPVAAAARETLSPVLAASMARDETDSMIAQDLPDRSSKDPLALRSTDGQLRAMRGEDRILRPVPRRSASWLQATGALAVLIVIAVAALFLTDRLPFLDRAANDGKASQAPAQAGPPIPAGPIIARTDEPASGAQRAGVPGSAGDRAGSAGTGAASAPAARTPSQTATRPNAPTQPTAAGSPRPAEDKLREARAAARREAERAQLEARANAEKASATAQQARARAGAARIRAAEAAKPDLGGAERVSFADGAVYVGQLADNRRSGLGVVELPSGERQAGEWLDDKLNGLGVVILQDGRRYEGEWKAQQREGLGVLVLGDGNLVAGTHAGAEVSGFAVWQEADGRERAGLWRHGKLEGPALEILPGERYEGEFRNGLRHGKGVLVRTDGSRHHGMFADGKPDGYGIQTAADGRQMSGLWSRDVLIRPE